MAYEHDFSDEDVQQWLDRQKTRYQTNGFGLWAMILKATGEMIGQAGLTMQPYKGKEILEIGYLLKKSTGTMDMPGKRRQHVSNMRLKH